ncbi:TetR/AcrR family transcriptional regulator [Glycomyces albidus]|jgi:AcrR family transcriptional regulator|uniref:TetR family transcriptional regulator n=1 Tax=Glycomyces albidus TaxID=2656774 RepID=A0A6L5GF92_9ACTN|nr:TetR/AcrR family transcriptional regulator [Glycomyces albidus]MQM28083.1 TetR family transcriptional regulator [Glycomyces albidus]
MAGPTNAERGRDVRERLLAAARELIGEIGWNAVSTRILAERAGVRSGLVHYHFASLQALLRQAATEAMRPMLEQAAELVAAAPSPGDAVEALLADIDRFTGTDPTSLLFVEAYLAATRDDLLRDQMHELVTDFRAALTAALARTGHPAPEAAATVLMAVVDGVLLHKGLDPQLSAGSLAPLLRRLADPEPNGANE